MSINRVVAPINLDMCESVKARFKLWLEKDGRPLLGEGGARLLRLIEETGSLSEAARRMGVSYTFAWNYIRKREKLLGAKLIESSRGGVHGGETMLTGEARRLLRLYAELHRAVERAVEEFCEKHREEGE